MSQSVILRSGDRRVRVISTDVSDGDFAVGRSASERTAVRRPIMAGEWTWLNQVHGTDVLKVQFPGQFAGAVADGAFTTTTACPIAVTTADCAPVVLTTTTGVAVVHAGWKGALAGIIGVAAEKLLSEGGEPEAAWLGPCIAAPSYEFSAVDLELLEQRFGATVVSKTSEGQPALDMFQVVSIACVEAGWPSPKLSPNTANSNFFSHRARGDTGRQTTVACIYE